MDQYKLLLFLHVVAVIIALGTTFSYPFLQGFAERKGVGATRFVLQFVAYLERMVVFPGAVLVFIFGLGLFLDGDHRWKDDNPAWLSIGMLWFIAAFLVAFFVQRPNVRKALSALDGAPDGAALPAAYVALSKRIQMVGGLLGLSIIGIAFLMIWKPGN